MFGKNRQQLLVQIFNLEDHLVIAWEQSHSNRLRIFLTDSKNKDYNLVFILKQTKQHISQFKHLIQSPRMTLITTYIF